MAVTTNAPPTATGPAPSANPMVTMAAFPDAHPRLSVATPSRLLLGTISSALLGLSLGATQGGQMAQLRFRAEHAHKMPDTTAGWYFYHKSKNYHAMQGGIREGFHMGFKTGFWTFVALSLESTVDRCRGASDMFSTTIATLTVAGAFSLWRNEWTDQLTSADVRPRVPDRLSMTAAARTARLGLMFGLAYGGVQDFVGLARGRPIGYVGFIKRRSGRTAPSHSDDDASQPAL
ncbi:hypothetical protein AK830_g10621 [Neonectria ditissima]|uniref:Mitochondrial import inner membrane translocase subunit TIM22 n=1 Tax=Neonectria ditissima TaxID=78410 RepID=A0A0P7APK1_9HYPO|nr:hypothetical protein AK830_g10621 [Neonectria ditissima]